MGTREPGRAHAERVLRAAGEATERARRGERAAIDLARSVGIPLNESYELLSEGAAGRWLMLRDP